MKIKDTLWDEILNAYGNNWLINDFTYDTWIVELKPLYFTNGILLLLASTPFAMEHIHREYKDIMLSIAQEVEPKLLEIRLTIEEDVPAPTNPIIKDKAKPKEIKVKEEEAPILFSGTLFENLPIIEDKPKPRKKPRDKIPKLDINISSKPKKPSSNSSNEEVVNFDVAHIVEMTARLKYQQKLNPTYRLDNFFTGKKNNFTLQTALEISKIALKPNRFNPLYIFGDAGVGKTHLIHGIGIAVEEDNNCDIVITTTNDFATNYASLFKDKEESKEDKAVNIKRFLNTFQEADLLLIDNIHHFAKREQNQSELYKIIEYRLRKQKQMVFTANRPIEDLMGIRGEITSRFAGGLSIAILPADTDTRLKIVRGSMKKEDIELTEDTIQYLALNGPRNLYELQGIIRKIVLTSSMTGKILKKTDILALLSEDNSVKTEVSPKSNRFSCDTIIAFTSSAFGVTKKMVLSKGRTKEVALARQVCMYLGHKYTDLSLKVIGAEFGGRNHSTVIHGYKTIQKRIDKNDIDLEKRINSIIDKMSRN